MMLARLTTVLPAVALLLAAVLPAVAEPRADEAEVRRQLIEAEGSIDRSFRNVKDTSPMPLTGITRGAYLQGFGAVFSLQVSLIPMPGLNPFRPQVTDEEKRELNMRKRQRLEDLELRARKILVEQGNRLTRVPCDEKVALIVSLLQYSWEDLSGLPAQMVMQAPRSVLVERGAGRLDTPAFKKRLEVQYF